MYAEHRYAPPQSRTVSLGGALLINGALIAGLIFAAPNVIPKGPEDGITVIPIRDPIDPPPIDQPKPKPDPREAQMPIPTAPTPEIRTQSPNDSETTEIIPRDPVPPLPPLPEPGPTYVAETKPPLPPLVTVVPELLRSRAMPLVGSARSQKYLKVCCCVSVSRSSSEMAGNLSAGSNVVINLQLKFPPSIFLSTDVKVVVMRKLYGVKYASVPVGLMVTVLSPWLKV